MSKTIGIDLGTTNSCVAVLEDQGAIVIPNAEGSRTTPSIVAFSKSGERLVGNAAARQATTNAANTVFAVKRLMGAEYSSPEIERHLKHVPYKVIKTDKGEPWVEIQGKQYSPPEISAMILQHLKSYAESYLGTEVSDAVITVPAYFNDSQRQATKAAGKIAGLNVKRIINEPTAAALAYGLDNKGSSNVAVYDLGGGTFDISILQISDGVFSVKATNGDTYLGGEDFDAAVVNFLADEFLKENDIDLRKDISALQRLKEQAQKARHELSSALETEINLPFIAADEKGPKHLSRAMKRSELEILVSDLVERSLDPCRKALEDSGLKLSDINDVILVGGMTRMPMIQEKVKEFFGKSPNRSVNPDEVVAVGAAIQGAALSGESQQVLLLDVTPLSLGVETGGGLFFKLISRNTTIPTHRSEIFTTSVDNQTFVPVHVLQGEREMSADNKSLAKFELSPIPPAPRGVPQIEVAFDIDSDGIVSVSAKDLGTGREQQVQVIASSGLTEEQIGQIIKDAEEYKDSDSKRRELAELRNGADALLYTTERAVEECAELVPAEVTETVKKDIDTLKALMQGEDVDSIRSALQQLEQSAYQIAEAMYGGLEE